MRSSINEIYPAIPAKGSVGASGDLAPLAHMAGILIGSGSARVDGKEITAAQALKKAGLKPIRLAPKEGLALLNGTQVSTAIALAAVFRTENLLAAAVTASAMAADAIKGSDTPFDARIHAARGHASQADIAQMLRDATGWQHYSRIARGLRPSAGSVLDSLSAAGCRCLPGRIAPRL